MEENWIVGSLDIEALFPSLDVSVCAEIAGRVLFESTIEFRNLQWKEIMMYATKENKERTTPSVHSIR